jgi:hypothetical protein
VERRLTTAATAPNEPLVVFRAEYDNAARCIRSRAVSLIPAFAACDAVGTG